MENRNGGQKLRDSSSVKILACKMSTSGLFYVFIDYSNEKVN